jgi:ATP adenylyltransferase
MRYVGGERTEIGCVFCNRLRSTDDRASLILHRGEHAYVIMNLFPYNTGHVMIVPNEHLPSPEALDDATTVEMARLVPRTLRALRAALNPAGFNLGINVGADAGAGIAAHLHQHVVPRWQGDANFMPILAGTMVLPELIPVTYAKIRAELARGSTPDVTIIAVDPDRQSLLVSSTGHPPSLPRVALGDGPVWQSASDFLSGIGDQNTLTGWAGAASVRETAPIALAYEISTNPSVTGSFRWIPLSEASTTLAPADFALLDAAVNLPPVTT